MAQISENTIELIRTTADIVDVISSYIELVFNLKLHNCKESKNKS